MLALAALGCGGGAYHEAVTRQHAALYGCDASEVHAATVAPRTWAAAGCGRRAIYVCRRGAVCVQEGETTATGEPSEMDRQEAELDRRAREEREAAVRAAPSAPELGATQREAGAVCGAQGGTFVPTVAPDGRMSLSCGLGGVRLFGARVDPETDRIEEVDSWIEGGSVPSLRARYTAELGAPVETLDARGIRTWTWTTDRLVLVLQMYERGAWVTVMRAPRPSAPQ